MGDQPTTKADSVVDVSYHMFYLADHDRPVRLVNGPTNGVVAVEPGGAAVFTGISEGPVRVSIELLSHSPAVVDDGWDEVVEVTMEAQVGRVEVQSLMGPRVSLPVLTPAGPGAYRVRVHCRGRDAMPDLAAFEPVEDFLIMVWPGPSAPEIIYKQSDRYGEGLRRSAASWPIAPPPEEPDPYDQLLADTLRRAGRPSDRHDPS